MIICGFEVSCKEDQTYAKTLVTNKLTTGLLLKVCVNNYYCNNNVNRYHVKTAFSNFSSIYSKFKGCLKISENITQTIPCIMQRFLKGVKMPFFFR